MNDAFNAGVGQGSSLRRDDVLHGRGAGDLPTASALVSDLDLRERRPSGTNCPR
ncbi:MAG: hypothetical protein ACLVB5_16320 [Christensenellales bacterium]